ncbi:MAG: class I SAM-dependent methyltransferase [Planctomycetes bacterium]|nr:class I SAM-dependent methyltransferase [Planctomycetota bacterium]
MRSPTEELRSPTEESRSPTEESRSVTSAGYWTQHNVTQHRRFATAEESLAYFQWRCDQYQPYLDLLPVAGHDGKVVLDYGCGPGHDLVGFAHYSNPARLIGMDVSPSSLDEARLRLGVHNLEAEYELVDENNARISLDDESVDYVHSSGVLHHVPDPVAVLREFRRVLRPGGEIRVMIYNYDSLWLHLYTAYVVRLEEGRYADLPICEAFRHLTDGPHCPISNVYRPAEFLSLATEAGLAGEHLGNALAMHELSLLPKRFAAVLDERFPREHRHFLLDLTFDERGHPFWQGERAGVDGCFRLWRS